VKIRPQKHIEAHKAFTGLVLVKTLAVGFFTLRSKNEDLPQFLPSSENEALGGENNKGH
jgi:hypothetical protein